MSVLSLLLAVAAVVGCVYWLVLVWSSWATMGAIPAIDELPTATPESPALVSIIVPARNEEPTVEAAMGSRLADPDPALEVVFVDDRSSDGTAAVVARMAEHEPRLRVVSIDSLPEGWLGKVHALHAGVGAARGEWLLFTDADVHLRPGSLRRVVSWAEAEGVDFVTAMPEVWSSNFWLDAVIGVFGRAFSFTTRPWRVHRPDTRDFLGLGAFNLVRREALDATPGLPWIRLDVGDDMALGMMMKRHGARCAVLNGGGHVQLAWYDTVGEMARGLEKSAFSVVGRFSLARLVFVAASTVMVEWGPLLALLPLGVAWLPWLGGAVIAVAGATLAKVCRWSRRPVLPSLMVPVGSLLFAAILVRAGVVGRRQGGVVWRDTLYPSELLRDRMRLELF